MFEQEAELGSDNEENDHVRKQINRDSEEEQDNDSLDQDLEELINNEKEEGDEKGALQKFFQDIKQDDKDMFKQAYKVTMGLTKKN